MGELILAKLAPSGYEELSHAEPLSTIENTRGRDMHWCHPAFANRRAYVHRQRKGVLTIVSDLLKTRRPPAQAPSKRPIPDAMPLLVETSPPQNNPGLGGAQAAWSVAAPFSSNQKMKTLLNIPILAVLLAVLPGSSTCA